MLRAEARGETLSARKVADAIAPRMRSTLCRLLREARAFQRSGGDPLAFVDAYVRPTVGNPEFALRRLFDEDELDDFAESAKFFADAAFPMTTSDVQDDMQSVVLEEQPNGQHQTLGAIVMMGQRAKLLKSGSFEQTTWR